MAKSPKQKDDEDDAAEFERLAKELREMGTDPDGYPDDDAMQVVMLPKLPKRQPLK